MKVGTETREKAREEVRKRNGERRRQCVEKVTLGSRSVTAKRRLR